VFGVEDRVGHGIGVGSWELGVGREKRKRGNQDREFELLKK
jgi:hypothetical protein